VSKLYDTSTAGSEPSAISSSVAYCNLLNHNSFSPLQFWPICSAGTS